MSSISDQQFLNDILRQKTISDAMAAFLRAVADATASAAPNGAIVAPATAIRYDSAAMLGIPVALPALLTINVPSGLARRDLFIRLPRINESSQAGGVAGVLSFFNQTSNIGTLPIDTSGLTHPVPTPNGTVAGLGDAVTYSETLAGPNTIQWSPSAANGTTPVNTRNVVIVTTRTNDVVPVEGFFYLPTSLRLELDVTKITLAWTTKTGGTNTGNEVLTGYLGCLTAPVL